MMGGRLQHWTTSLLRILKHDVCVYNGKPVLLSTYDYIYEALGIKSDEEKAFQVDF